MAYNNINKQANKDTPFLSSFFEHRNSVRNLKIYLFGKLSSEEMPFKIKLQVIFDGS